MRMIAKITALAMPVALSCAACGGSDTYVQPTEPSNPVTVVQPPPAQAPAPAPAAPPTTNVEVNTAPQRR
jgi:ABC-type glycerol-3-phosphate transport system substrate-binding protein